jgi:hypothetical protein
MPARVWEMQSRGVLHAHVVVPCGSGIEKAAAEFYVAELHRLAGRYGFGFVDRKVEAMTARAAAAYLSAYFVSGKKNKLQLHESVMAPSMPRSIVDVSTRLTQHTGVTMRELRFRRFVWVRYRGLASAGGPLLQAARHLARIEIERGAELSGEEKAHRLAAFLATVESPAAA